MSGAPRAGIVLAGGRGTRLGPGPPKALRPFGKTTLLLRTVQMLGARCERIFVAVPPVFPLPPGPYSRVDDLDVAGAGPFAGLVPALEQASASRAAIAFVVAVDMPEIAPIHLDTLELALDPQDGPRATSSIFKPGAAVPRTARGPEPLVGAYRPAWAAPILRETWKRGERSVHRALSDLGSRLVLIDAEREDLWPGGAATLAGLNTPEDWDRAVERERGPGGGT
jgi:molybdopterin-guanine dinucleotide biosynthesis protein A